MREAGPVIGESSEVLSWGRLVAHASWVRWLWPALLLVPFAVPMDDRQRRIGNLFVLFVLAGAMGVMSLRLGWRTGLDSASRSAWRWFGGAFALRCVPMVMFVAGELTGVEPLFGAGNVLRIMTAPLIMIGLLRLPGIRRRRVDQRKLGLDVAIVLTGSSLAIWYFIVGPALTLGQPSMPIVVLAVVEPIGNFLVMYGALVAGTRVTRPCLRQATALLVAGACTESCGDLYLSYLNSRGTTILTTAWPMIFWLIGHALYLQAALVQRSQTAHLGTPDVDVDGTADGNRPVLELSLLPYLSVALVYSLAVTTAMRFSPYPWGGMVLGLGAVTALVLTRQMVVTRENHDLIFADPLTHLANRRRLQERLGREFAESQRADRRMAVLLIDMNRFKEVNDTLGHEAGDALLVGMAGFLRAIAPPPHLPARLGGDEFAVMLHDCDLDDAIATVVRLGEAMGTAIPFAGCELYAQAAVGIAARSDSDPNPAHLLSRADEAMYRGKKNQTQFEVATGTLHPRLSHPAREARPGGGLSLAGHEPS